MQKNRRSEDRSPIWVSQNFLTSRRIIGRLLHQTSITPNDHIIEIGPGKGHITDVLVKRSHRVTAIEADQGLYLRLKEKFFQTNNLMLRHQDFLTYRLPDEPYKVFSNIPFNLTSDIMRKLTECSNSPQEAWLVMEKGAAKRFMGKPFETMGSLLLKPRFDMKIVYYFNREDFHPKPSVDVVLVHLKKKSLQTYHPNNGPHIKSLLLRCKDMAFKA